MAKRLNRHDTIRWIVRNKTIRTQSDLADELRLEGFDCTQATVSRDIADMGLRKIPGGLYVLAEDLHLKHMFSEFVHEVERAENLVVAKTQLGTASGVAAALDAAGLPDVMGSIAGNDIVLVITRNSENAEIVADTLRELCADVEEEE